MSLPQLTTPIHYMVIPSTNKKIKYRPFLVKEEKVLMLVKESKDADEILSAMKEIINACTFGELNPDELAMFDVEYIFLQLRSKSVGEIVELNMRCMNDVSTSIHSEISTIERGATSCGGTVPFSIDISKIKVNTPENHRKSIVLDGDIGITFKYPSIDTMHNVEKTENYADDIDLIVDLVDNIFDKDNVYDAKDTNRDEIVEFVEGITHKQFTSIKEGFFHTIPTMEHTVKYKCPSCGYESEYTFRGISDFF